MDGVIQVDLTKRLRVAELVPDERVFAVGELQRVPDPEAPTAGYRQKAEGYRLVPPRGRPMLLSSKPLGERFARWASFHRGWAIFAAVAALAVNGVFAPFHARRWLGETVEARVTQLREYEDSNYTDSDDKDRYEVTMQVADDFTFSDEVSASDFLQLHQGDRVQVRYVPSWRYATAIGSDVTVSSYAFIAILLLLFIAIAYPSYARAKRPWYENRKLVEKGSGRLADSH
jgi:hypothetical protein